MKSIANQYRDLKEGRMSQANFMRNLRMTMPQFVTNTTSFGDAIRILKNKSILNENMDPKTEEEVFSQGAQDESNTAGFDNEEIGDDEIDAILKGIEQEKAGEEAVMSQYDETINEGKGKELHPNQINPDELRMGIKVELEHTDDLDKAKKIALDHLRENPFYYTELKLSGLDAAHTTIQKPEAPKKAKKVKPEMIDKDNQMQKIKLVKEAKFNAMPGEEPNATVQHAIGFIQSNPVFLLEDHYKKTTMLRWMNWQMILWKFP